MQRLVAGELLALLICTIAACDSGTRLEYVIEYEGHAVGRLDVRLHPVDADSSDQVVTVASDADLQVLGRTVTLSRRNRLRIDPRSGLLRSAECRTRMGDDLEMTASFRVTDDSIRVRSTQGADLCLARAPDLIAEDGLHYRWLLARLGAGMDTVGFRTVDLDRGTVLAVKAVAEGVDTLRMARADVAVAVISLHYPAFDRPRRLWIDPRDGLILRATGSDGAVVRRGRLTPGQAYAAVPLDSMILAPTDTFIVDERAIRAMTVRAVIETPGVHVDAAALTVPGQRFTGTVDGGRIEGVFTIRHEPFEAADSPPWPPRTAAPEESLRAYVAPAPLIESDDPAIVSLAQQLVAGSAHRWDATQRLARWVSEEIAYDIPGGGTASATLRLRRGECGSHARLLAALCRAVAIPARVVIGGMYFHDTGGAFGQHAWTEIHLGEAGWIPLDATLGEVDVLDSGHIRLGESAPFFPRSVEILSFELESHR